jgi:IS30 family transposase
VAQSAAVTKANKVGRAQQRMAAGQMKNGLLRQYLPKGFDFPNYSQADLDAVGRRLNERPRNIKL